MVDYPCQGGQIYSQWQCNTIFPDSIGGRGATYWGFPTGYSTIIQAYGTGTFSFTCTTPRCYSTQDNCNVYFNAYANSNNNPDVNLVYSLNGNPAQGYWASGVANHGARQGFDVSQVNGYNDVGSNTFTIYNNSPVSVTIQDFKIMRVYQMCNLVSDDCHDACDENGECEPLEEDQANGNMDASRYDAPCNCESGNTISFTTYSNSDYYNTIIPAGGTLDFNFNWTSHCGNNYQGGSVCIFNFNQIIPTTFTSEVDVTLTAYLNNSTIPFTNYYLSNQYDHGSYPSWNLMQEANYNDSGINIIKLVNNSTISLQMIDTGGINIYRTYKTSQVNCCFCTCQTCQTACEIVCQSCYTCQLCYTTCQEPCEISCQDCQEPCEIACQECQTCQEPCQVSCQPGCQTSCQICYLCVTCYSCFVMCQEMCQISCQEQCEICQEACQIACQGCQISCQEPCQIECQECQGCQTCVECQMLETCPIVYYTCQSCQTCQPAYA